MNDSSKGQHLTGGLLGLHALTSLHPGSGTALGTVDLPVQRERHTQWPNIAGSALKGILRDASRSQIAQWEEEKLNSAERYDDGQEDETEEDRANRRKDKTKRERADATLELTKVFGPPSGSNSEHAGALSVTDARLIAFPVRSLKGVFAWVTCPQAISRLQRDAAMVGLSIEGGTFNPEVNQAIVANGSPCLCPDDQIILEEFLFKKTEGDPSGLGGWIAKKLLPSSEAYQSTRDQLPRHLVVLHDDDFTHFARQATEVMARVQLSYETKTVKEGALFYQEFLPAETLFCSVVIANSARTRRGNGTAKEVLATLEKYLPGLLQVGGDETTGKGYCATRLTSKGEG